MSALAFKRYYRLNGRVFSSQVLAVVMIVDSFRSGYTEGTYKHTEFNSLQRPLNIKLQLL